MIYQHLWVSPANLTTPLLLDAIKRIIRLTQTHNTALGCYVNDFESGETVVELGGSTHCVRQ